MSTAGLSLEKDETARERSAPPPRILVVDGEEFVREILVRKLRGHGYVCESCGDGTTALRMLSAQPCDLVLTDIKMPGIKGVEVIQEAQRVCPEVGIILVTSVTDLDVAVEAIKHGAYDYITKPFSLEEVTIAVTRALEKRRLLLENRRYQRTLEEQVVCRTRQCEEALEELRTTYYSTLLALGTALDSRESDTGWHSLRVTMYAARLARQLGVPGEDMRELEHGALLHDIGKIGVPDDILRKPDRLSEKEWVLMRKHPEIGYRILSGIKFLQGAARMVLHHHERFDGTGYPNGLKGDEIDLGARIFAVADTLDCMTSDRPFDSSKSFETMQDEIRSAAGTQFDPRIVKAFLEISVEEWKGIRQAVAERVTADF